MDGQDATALPGFQISQHAAAGYCTSAPAMQYRKHVPVRVALVLCHPGSGSRPTPTKRRSRARWFRGIPALLCFRVFAHPRWSPGILEYRWSTSKDERVRHDHKALDTKIFSFASPPVTNLKTGARNNPGCDFGCRCIAIPIFRDTPAERRTPMMVE